LSGRDGTLFESVSADSADSGDSGDSAQILPSTVTDFTELACDYGHRLIADPLAPPPSTPVAVRIADAGAPAFSHTDQIWWQRLFDSRRQGLRLEVTLRDPGSAAISKTLDRLWSSGKRWDSIFGLLSYRKQTLSLFPISIRCRGESAWTHLTLS
jgi:hypothetical protein